MLPVAEMNVRSFDGLLQFLENVIGDVNRRTGSAEIVLSTAFSDFL